MDKNKLKNHTVAIEPNLIMENIKKIIHQKEKKKTGVDKFKITPIYQVYDLCSLVSKPTAWGVNDTY